MIRVKEEKKVNEIKETRCDWCNTILEYTDEDVHEIYCGRGFKCPKCGEDVFIGPPEKIVYPDSFYDFKNGVDICDEDIQKYVDDVYKTLKESGLDIDYAYSGTGNTIVIGLKCADGELAIIVAKKYLEYNEPLEED